MRFSAGSVWENNGIYDGKISSAWPGAMQAEGHGRVLLNGCVSSMSKKKEEERNE